MGVPLDVEVDRVDATKALFCMTDVNIVITGKVPRIQSIGTKSRIPVLRYRKSIVLLYLSFSRILYGIRLISNGRQIYGLPMDSLCLVSIRAKPQAGRPPQCYQKRLLCRKLRRNFESRHLLLNQERWAQVKD